MGKVVATLPAVGEVESVVSTAGGWRVLARIDAGGEPSFRLLGTPPQANGEATQLELDVPRFPGDAASFTGPFLSVEPGGALTVTFMGPSTTTGYGCEASQWPRYSI